MKKSLLAIPAVALVLGCGSAIPDGLPERKAPAPTITPPSTAAEHKCFDDDLKEVQEHFESKTWHAPESCKALDPGRFYDLHLLVLLTYEMRKR